MHRGYPMVWRSSARVRLWRQWRWVFVTALLFWAAVNPAAWFIALLGGFYLIGHRCRSVEMLSFEPVWLREDGSGFNEQDHEIQVMPPVLMFPGLCICRIQREGFDSFSEPSPAVWLWRWRDQCEPTTWTRFCRILQHCREQSSAHPFRLLNQVSWIAFWRKNRRQ